MMTEKTRTELELIELVLTDTNMNDNDKLNTIQKIVTRILK